MGLLNDIVRIMEDYDTGLILKSELPDTIREAITKNEEEIEHD